MKMTRVLVVDDEQLVRWFLDRALRKGGFEVVAVSNITEAYELLSKEQFDLLFLDLRMPQGSGTDLIGKIDRLPQKPKIVVCSAFITSDLDAEFRSKGIFVLKKPFKLDELSLTVKQCLGQ
ncbi:MAG: hypothetical protein OHK006_20840 [Thermodesulfovibrionales bacterium]